jgi:hypothetical protein
MRAIDLACAAAVVVWACAPTDQNGSGSGGAPRTQTLSIHSAGNGSGTVRSADPAFECSAQCAQSLAANANVRLTAVPASGSTFAGWQGACSGMADCALTMDLDRDVTANFSTSSPPPGMARVDVVPIGKGSGRVTSLPAGIYCPAICSMSVAAGTSISLMAMSDASSSFIGWGGACSGGGDCSFTANADQTAWANFDLKTPPPQSCSAIAPPDDVPMQQFVHTQDGTYYACFPGLGDANGTLAFPRAFSDASHHGSVFEFVTTANVHLGERGGTSEGPRPQQQPSGLVMYGDRGHMFPVQDAVLIRSWDSSGKALGDAVLRAQNVSGFPDPAGGLLLAGDLSIPIDPSAVSSHSAAMYTGGGSAPILRWGPNALASSGTVYGTGVDLLGRALVITDGRAKFGRGTISAQWFERDGRALTDEFVLVSGFSAGESTWFETSPLIGSGLAVQRVDYTYSQIGTYHAHALVLVGSGQPSVQPAPDWMVARPDTRLQIVRGGRAYAVIPYGAKGAACTQRIEVVAPDGSSCGARSYPIASGNCDTHQLSVGADGTVIQMLPDAMETKDPIAFTHTCTWRWWPAALQ